MDLDFRLATLSIVSNEYHQKMIGYSSYSCSFLSSDLEIFLPAETISKRSLTFWNMFRNSYTAKTKTKELKGIIQ